MTAGDPGAGEVDRGVEASRRDDVMEPEEVARKQSRRRIMASNQEERPRA